MRNNARSHATQATQAMLAAKRAGIVYIKGRYMYQQVVKLCFAELASSSIKKCIAATVDSFQRAPQIHRVVIIWLNEQNQEFH